MFNKLLTKYSWKSNNMKINNFIPPMKLCSQVSLNKDGEVELTKKAKALKNKED
jgi:hypothetical protein